MKKISTIFLAMLLLLSASPPIWANREITLVNSLKPWDKFDKYLGVYFYYGSNGGTRYPNNVLGWQCRPYSEIRFDAQSPVGLAASADLSLITGEKLTAFVPTKWTGQISADVRHAFILPAHEDQYKDEILVFDCPAKADDFIGTICKDFINLARNIYTVGPPGFIPDPEFPDDDVTYTDAPEHMIVMDKDGNTIAAADLVYERARIEPNGPSKTKYYYSNYYSFSETVTLRREQFPLYAYFVTFSTTQHKISITVDEAMGKITPSDDQMINQGEGASFAVTANDGYRITSLLIDGVPVAVDSKYLTEYTFEKVEKPHTLEAVFEEDKNAPEISADSGVSGSVVNLIESASDAVVSDFENGGFTGGGKTVHVVNLDRDTKTEGTFAADADGFVQAVKLSVEYEEGAESQGLTLTVRPLDAAKPFSADKSYCALLLNKKTNYYDVFPAARGADGNLTVKIRPVGDYFSEGTIFVYSGTVTDGGTPADPVTPGGGSGSKSGSGCAAGGAALALLALVPIAAGKRR